MKKNFLALIFAGLAMLFIACSSQEDKQSLEQKSLNNKTILIGLNAAYPPFEYEKDSKIIGFDVELIDAISKKVGFKYEFVNMSFDGLIPALLAGKIDMIISSMSATKQREKSVDFSIPYYIGETLYIKQKDNDSIKTKKDLESKSIGVLLGSVQDLEASKIKDANILRTTIANAFINLDTNKVDALLSDSATASGYLEKYSNIEAFYKEEDGSQGLSIAFPKQNKDFIEKINNAINELEAEGVINELKAKYKL